MAAVGEGRSAQGITQGPGPYQGQRLRTHTERRLARRIDGALRAGRKPRLHRVEIRLDVGQLRLVEQPFEDVEAELGVCLANGLAEAPVLREVKPSAIGQRERPLLPLLQITAHRFGLISVVLGAGLDGSRDINHVRTSFVGLIKTLRTVL